MKNEKKWYVLYTKPNFEKKVAKSLENLELEVYCPLRKEIRQWSDRKKNVEVPLFSSYVFVRTTPKNRSLVFNTAGVIRFLYWLGKPAVVRDEEIDTIKQWLENDSYHDVNIENYQPGRKVQITSGPFKEKEGVIHHINKKRLQLLLPELGCSVSVKIREVA